MARSWLPLYCCCCFCCLAIRSPCRYSTHQPSFLLQKTLSTRIRKVLARQCNSAASEAGGTPAAVPIRNEVRQIDETFMRMALTQAKEAFDEGEIPVGAVLVDGAGKVLSKCRNMVEASGDASAHAELLCLRQAAKERSAWRMTDATLYVTLEPCLMCLGSIQSFRVSRVVYGAKNHLLGAVESFIRVLDHKHPFHTVEVSGGVLSEECGAIMKDFFVARRRGLLVQQHRTGGRPCDDGDDPLSSELMGTQETTGITTSHSVAV